MTCNHPDVRYCEPHRGAVACFTCGRLFGHLQGDTFVAFNADGGTLRPPPGRPMCFRCGHVDNEHWSSNPHTGDPHKKLGCMKCRCHMFLSPHEPRWITEQMWKDICRGDLPIERSWRDINT